MIGLFLNGLAASAGGGLTYLRNVIPQLSERNDVRLTVALSSDLALEFRGFPNISIAEISVPVDALRRFWWEQTRLSSLIKRSGAEVLISTGNFAIRKSPVPQILLARNSLYTSREFRSDLRSRHEFRLLADTALKSAIANKSMQWADRVVAPSQAFATELQQWGATNVHAIHHGFDSEKFFHNTSPLPAEVAQKLKTKSDALRLLFVSHYNYFRNFETLFRAVALMKQRSRNREVKLFLTCDLKSKENLGTYRAESAAALIEQLDISGNVIQLGPIPYDLLYHLYRACDIYVTPAYAESFAHPVVEAMASGLPVVASDLEVHREVCGEAAIYFARFSPDDLAARVLRLSNSPELTQTMSQRSLARSQHFSWNEHVNQIVGLAKSLADS